MLPKIREIIRCLSVAGVAAAGLSTFALAADFPPSRAALNGRPRLSAIEVHKLAYSKFFSIYLEMPAGEKVSDRALAKTVSFTSLYAAKCSKNDETLKAILGIIEYFKFNSANRDAFIKDYLQPEMRSIVKLYGDGPSMCEKFEKSRAAADQTGWSYYSVIEQIDLVATYRKTGDIPQDYGFLKTEYIANLLDKDIEQLEIMKTRRDGHDQRPLSRPDYPWDGERQVLDEALENYPALSRSTISACQAASKPLDEHRVVDLKVLREIKTQDRDAKVIIISLQDRSYAQRWVDKQSDYDKNGYKIIDDRKTFYYVCGMNNSGRVSFVEIYVQERTGDPVLSRKVNL